MAAPIFVGAGTGVIIQTGGAGVGADGVAVAAGDLVVLQVLQDGTTASAVSLSTPSNLNNLAGAAGMTVIAATQQIGSPVAARQHLWVGRATSTSLPQILVSTTGDDLYCRMYVFRGVHTGTALTDVIENSTAGSFVNGAGATAAISDSSVVTTGPDRLALQFVAVDDDNPVGPFTGMTGGTWAEAVAEFASATGTDGCIQLQIEGLDFLITTGSGNAVGTTTTPRRAQSFVPNFTGTLSSVWLRLRKAGTPTDNLVVEIQTDSAGSPSGTAVGSAVSIPGSSLTTTETNTPINGLGASLTSGTTYWIVLRRSGAAADANFYTAMDADSNIYASGVQKDYNGTSWLSALAYDLAFRLNMPSAGTIDGGSFTMAAADNWGVIGLALIPPASGTAWAQPVADTLALVDAQAFQSGKSAAIPDTLTLADTQAFQAVYARAVDDTLAVTDAVRLDRTLTLADTIALADLATANRVLAQVIDDTLTAADALAFARELHPTDTVALADAQTFQAALARTVADTLSLTDTLAAQAAYQLAITDTLTLTDLADPVKSTGGVAHSQPVADTFTLADAVAFARAYQIADTVSLTDAATTTGAGAQTIADTLAIADALRFDQTRTFTDTLAVADAVAFQAVLVRGLADTLALADALSAERGLARALADTVSLADLLAFQRGFAQALADSVTLSDDQALLLLAALAPILNYAIDIRWGETQADNVYVGDELVWTP